jgi:hypothetical protein
MQMATSTRSLLQVRATRPGYREAARQLADRGIQFLREARKRWREMEAQRKGAAVAATAAADDTASAEK